MKSTSAVVALTALGLALAACSPTQNVRGHVVDPRVVDSIRPGVDNQSSVRAMMGSPSVTGTLTDDRWYYVSRKTETVAFFRPNVIDHRVVQIVFDDAGYVNGVHHIGMEDTRSVSPVGEETPTRGRELGFWEQIFGNVGRFSGGQGAGGP